MVRLSFLLSILFHPLFITLYAALYYINTLKSNVFIHEKLSLISDVLLYTLILPLLIYLFLKQYGQIKSILTANTKERKLPLGINCVLLLLLLNQIDAVHLFEFHQFILGCLICNILSLFYSFLDVKISLHLIGVTVLSVFIVSLPAFGWIEIIVESISIATIGWVASSRLLLKAHNYREISLGFINGILPMLVLKVL